MNARRPWQGMLIIARLNWPFYGAVVAVLVVAIAGWIALPTLWPLFALALAGCLYFLVGSLGVSHWIYDRSDLYRWGWTERALAGLASSRVIFCHSGFDEASELLREKLQPDHWLVLDHFDPTQMTEASIRRARALYPPTPQTLPAPFDRWPAESDGASLIFGLLAIHELRSEAERTAWFTEAKRCLAPKGRIVIGEHVRDLANFLAFGPGFVHFHSVGSWQQCWQNAGLHCRDRFRITPFVRVFVLEK